MSNEHCLSLVGTWHNTSGCHCRCSCWKDEESHFWAFELEVSVHRYSNIYLLCDHLKRLNKRIGDRERVSRYTPQSMLTQSKSCFKSFTKVRALIVTLLLMYYELFRQITFISNLLAYFLPPLCGAAIKRKWLSLCNSSIAWLSICFLFQIYARWNGEKIFCGRDFL